MYYMLLFSVYVQIIVFCLLLIVFCIFLCLKYFSYESDEQKVTRRWNDFKIAAETLKTLIQKFTVHCGNSSTV